MISRFSLVLLSMISPIAFLINPAQANEKSYPEPILRSLVEACMDEKGIFIPFQSTVKTNKKLPDIINDYQTQLKKSIARYEQQSEQQKQILEAAVQKRLVELKKQIENKDQLKQELKTIREILATGSINGQKLSPEDLAGIKKSEQDLLALEKDPNYVEVMAKAASEQELKRIQNRDQAFKTQSNQGLTKLTQCGCAVEKIQKQYEIEALADRIKVDVLGKEGLSKDIQMNLMQCR